MKISDLDENGMPPVIQCDKCKRVFRDIQKFYIHKGLHTKGYAL